MPDFSHENSAAREGYKIVCGVDEAGRGPLCGPVVAAAVILPPGIVIEKLDDSKKLTEKVREELFEKICGVAISYSVASASVEEIDELNILGATLLAMQRAVDSTSVKPDLLLVDGNVAKGFSIPARAIVGGDGVSASIAAASVLAKVTRDRICAELDTRYPDFGIAQHKGYCTKLHIEALKKYGPTPIHRSKFIRFLQDVE